MLLLCAGKRLMSMSRSVACREELEIATLTSAVEAEIGVVGFDRRTVIYRSPAFLSVCVDRLSYMNVTLTFRAELTNCCFFPACNLTHPPAFQINPQLPRHPCCQALLFTLATQFEPDYLNHARHFFFCVSCCKNLVPCNGCCCVKASLALTLWKNIRLSLRTQFHLRQVPCICFHGPRRARVTPEPSAAGADPPRGGS